MSLKQKFLKIKTYQEFDKRRNEFKNLNLQDTEISNHLKELFPSVDNSDFENGIITEVYAKSILNNRVLFSCVKISDLLKNL